MKNKDAFGDFTIKVLALLGICCFSWLLSSCALQNRGKTFQKDYHIGR